MALWIGGFFEFMNCGFPIVFEEAAQFELLPQGRTQQGEEPADHMTPRTKRAGLVLDPEVTRQTQDEMVGNQIA